MNTPVSNRSGSALLLTLMVTSLLIMIALAFTVHVRMELRSVNARMESMWARNHAKLGMHLALARLQETAGADQRATATAEILGDLPHPSNHHITGVWDTQDPAEDPQWLISTPAGAVYDISTSTASGDTTLLLGKGSSGKDADPDDLIRAPKISIDMPDHDGSYAYWVADEGVKASLGLHNRYVNEPRIANLHRTEMDRLRYAVPVRNAQEHAFTTPVDFEDQRVDSFVGFSHRLNEFPFLDGLSNPQKQGGFHHYTHNAKGLLTRPVDGGIKKDLSLAPELFPSPGDGFEQFMNYQNYLQTPSPGTIPVKSEEDLRRLHLITPPSNLNPVEGEVVHGVAPVITDFGIQFSPHPTSGGNRTPLLSMLFVLELWNPFTTGLEAEDLVLEIEGMRPITMILVDPNTDEEVWEHTFDMAETFGETIPIRLTRGQYHTTEQFLGPDSYDTHAHGPGRLLYWTGPDTNSNKTPDRFTGTFANRNSSNTRMVLPAKPVKNFPSGNHWDVRYQMPETSLTVTLRKADTNQALSVYRNFLYDEVDSGVIGKLGEWTRRFLTYRFRIIERGTTYGADRSAWLKYTDKRSPSPNFGDDARNDTHTMHESATSYSPFDSGLKNYLSVNQDGKRFYFDRVLSNSPWSRDYRRDIPLFELPRQPLLSIGQLQHLYIHGMPPYSIGNPWGGEEWNRLFDDYFLSGVQPGISIPELGGKGSSILPHPRLSPTHPSNLDLTAFNDNTIPDLGENSALAFHVDGQFNINSVSTEAWKTVLAGARFANLRHMERDTDLHDQNNPSTIVGTRVEYPSGFTRFPHSIQEVFDVDAREFDSDFDRHMLNLKPGVTFLHPRTAFPNSNGKNQIDDNFDGEDDRFLNSLTDTIVSGIRQRVEAKGRPYFSLNELITEIFHDGRPLLEHGIAISGLRRIHAPSGDFTPEERVPSWLSQADVLSALAPVLSTRSDTFVIRSYGEVETPNGDLAPRAWCEAVVQRVVTPVESVASLSEMADVPNETFGRRFKIISFKWLLESEI